MPMLDEIEININETKTQIYKFSLAIKKKSDGYWIYKGWNWLSKPNHPQYREKTMKEINFIFVGIEETEESKTELEMTIIAIIKK